MSTIPTWRPVPTSARSYADGVPFPSDPGPRPPSPKRETVERIHHSDRFIDDYEWMRDKDAADVIAHLEAENAYTAAVTAHLEPLRQSIFDEIKNRTQETDLSVPTRRGMWWYYTRTREGAQYPLWCRCPAQPDDWTPPEPDPAADLPGEQLLLDGNAEADGHEFFDVGAFAVSPDARLLAYSVDTTGDERYTVRFKDLDNGEMLPDEIDGTLGEVAWSTDASTVWYATVNAAWRQDAVWRHRLGTGRDANALVHREDDERFNVSVARTTSGRFIAVSSASKVTSEVRVLDAATPTADLRVVVPRQTGVEYALDHLFVGGADRFVVVHNSTAPNFTIGVGPVDLTSLDQLDTLLAPSERVRLTTVRASARHLVVDLRENGLAQVRTYPVGSTGIGSGSNVAFDEALFAASSTAFTDWDQPYVRLSYGSWVTPATVYELEPVSGELHLRKRQPILGGYDPADYVQTREWTTARDGTAIPISLVHHRSVTPRSGSPLVLYGYGAYEISIEPSVWIARLSLLDRGLVWAVAHVRGGGEMGRHWYDEGRLLHKRNTFTDFVDVARHLVDTEWTSSQRLVAIGGSAGGLTVGAAVNEDPDLFVGVLAIVPFVDALTTILDPSLPLTVSEWDEWGDPLHDPDFYAYMKSYTPYENIRPVVYPAVYAPTSLHDTRVFYVEPAKWVARLRDVATGAAPVLLKVEMDGGHGGVSGRYDSWREIADQFAWVIDTCGAPG